MKTPLVYALHAAAMLARDDASPVETLAPRTPTAGPAAVPAPAPAAAIDPSGEVAALRRRVDELLAQLAAEREARRFQTQAFAEREIALEAEAFVDALVWSRRFPASHRVELVAMLVRAGLDDRESPAEVPRSTGNGRLVVGTRLDAIRATLAKLPSASPAKPGLRLVDAREQTAEAFVIGSGLGE